MDIIMDVLWSLGAWLLYLYAVISLLGVIASPGLALGRWWRRRRCPLVITPTDMQTRPEGWCARHDVPMTLRHKNGRQWYSHKTAAGWCKGR
jgi:hypothetical protein